jgi:hypothetical protein
MVVLAGHDFGASRVCVFGPIRLPEPQFRAKLIQRNREKILLELGGKDTLQVFDGFIQTGDGYCDVTIRIPHQFAERKTLYVIPMGMGQPDDDFVVLLMACRHEIIAQLSDARARIQYADSARAEPHHDAGGVAAKGREIGLRYWN